jgi:crossover junction endodeoxyribonuclease RuvC
MPKWRASSWRAFDPGAMPREPERPLPGAGLPTAAPMRPGGPRARSAQALPDLRVRVRILGLDPGSRRMGYGLIDCHGSESRHVAHGCVVPRDESIAARLRFIFEAVAELIEKHRPDEIAVERVFVNRNVDSALKLGQARGAALSAVPRGTGVFEYAPRAIKMAVVGFGGADKSQVAHMMRALLSLSGSLGADAADALAVAVCHAHSRRLGAILGTGARTAADVGAGATARSQSGPRG